MFGRAAPALRSPEDGPAERGTLIPDFASVIVRVLLLPIELICRLFIVIIEADLWPPPWTRWIERNITGVSAEWSIWRRLLACVLASLLGFVLWLLFGGVIAIAVVQGWIGATGAVIAVIVASYLLMGGAIATAVLVLARKRRNGPSPIDEPPPGEDELDRQRPGL